MPQADDARTDGRADIALLLRGISDEYWNSTVKFQASNLMLRFPQEGCVGFNADVVREAILLDMDRDFLSEIVGREMVSRLRRGWQRTPVCL
ncbi:hypothetical protein [Bradyrhizobium genosp. P]|uniref:hypothetical protein n=1 Tax=Bradyrhizobium genosp. P TaxID=83641 RepID=UPI003CF67745